MPGSTSSAPLELVREFERFSRLRRRQPCFLGDRPRTSGDRNARFCKRIHFLLHLVRMESAEGKSCRGGVWVLGLISLLPTPPILFSCLVDVVRFLFMFSAH